MRRKVFLKREVSLQVAMVMMILYVWVVTEHVLLESSFLIQEERAVMFEPIVYIFIRLTPFSVLRGILTVEDAYHWVAVAAESVPVSIYRNAVSIFEAQWLVVTL